MKMLLQQQAKQLRINSAASILSGGGTDPKPVVKFFNPCGAATWLITEMDEDGRMFGLCDMGMGSPDLGYVMYSEILATRLPFGLKIERDRHWKASKPISEYASEARELGRIAA